MPLDQLTEDQVSSYQLLYIMKIIDSFVSEYQTKPETQVKAFYELVDEKPKEEENASGWLNNKQDEDEFPALGSQKQ
jgi:hypothetical protein